MDKKTRNQAIKTIKATWHKISYYLSSKGWCTYHKQYLAQNVQESKEHHNYRGSDIKRGISISEEAQYFAVRNITRPLYKLEKYTPQVKDYFHVKQSVFMGYALAKEYGKDLKKIISKSEAEYIDALDYCELIEAV